LLFGIFVINIEFVFTYCGSHFCDCNESRISFRQ